MSLGPHTITRLRAQASTDPYSQESAPDWNLPPVSELSVPGCSVQPGPPQRVDRDRRDGVTILYSVWAPVTDVTEQDRIRFAGEVYAIDDTIQIWDFGPLGHAVIPLKRVEG